MHESIVALTNYLKYDRIFLEPVDVMKMVDAYMRITATITNNHCDNTKALYMTFDPTKKIDFWTITDGGIENIKNYIANLSSCADLPINDEALDTILKDKNIVTIFKAIHLYIDAVVGFATRYVESISGSTIAPFEYRCYSDEENSAVKILAFRNSTGEIEYQIVSDCLLRSMPYEPDKMV